MLGCKPVPPHMYLCAVARPHHCKAEHHHRQVPLRGVLDFALLMRLHVVRFSGADEVCPNPA